MATYTSSTNKYKILFLITLLVALVLTFFIIYNVLVKPQIQGLIIEKQKDTILLTMINQIQKQGYTQITVDNQSLFLVPFDPNQPAQQLQDQLNKPVRSKSP